MILKSNLILKPFWAFTAWPFIVVRPEYADDAGILVHEMVHYREQAWITPIWLIRYWLSKSFRIAAEVRAYKAQITGGHLSALQATTWLIKYDSALTEKEAFRKLTL
jgi:hypothetical protein